MSHGSGDEENYWPGYVDALTSMVQVLAFVMMMLAMAVYILSQNTSRSAVESIAKAMNVQTPAGASVSQLTNAVIEAAEKAGKTEKAAEAANSASSKESSPAPLADANAAPAQPDPQARPTPAPQSDPAPASTQAATPPPAPSVASLASPESQHKTPAAHPAAPGAAPAAPEGGGTAEGAELRAAEPYPLSAPLKPVVGKSLAVHFTDRGYAVSADDKAKIEAFLADGKALKSDGQIFVQAYAATGTAALTEARHAAFYRAMTLRAELLNHKLPPNRIKIRVLDASDKPHESLVELVLP